MTIEIFIELSSSLNLLQSTTEKLFYCEPVVDCGMIMFCFLYYLVKKLIALLCLVN